MFLLTTPRLRVEVSEPGENPNTAFRFDRAGFISEVTLDGDRHFCANEPRNLRHPSSSGRGLCCEYTADYSKEVAEGELYPKIGVGLIPKDGDYVFHHRYKGVQEFPVHFEKTEDTAVFKTEAVSCLGIAVESTKTIHVEDNHLSMEVTLKNVGERTIITGEYCHNFLSIDGMAVAPDYKLDLPFAGNGLEGRDIPNEYPGECNFAGEKDGVGFKRVDHAVSLAHIPLDSWDGKMPFNWTLSHAGAKAWVSGSDEIKSADLKLWAVDHIVSPEIEQKLVIEPGQTISWKRTWTFEQK